MHTGSGHPRTPQAPVDLVQMQLPFLSSCRSSGFCLSHAHLPALQHWLDFHPQAPISHPHCPGAAPHSGPLWSLQGPGCHSPQVSPSFLGLGPEAFKSLNLTKLLPCGTVAGRLQVLGVFVGVGRAGQGRTSLANGGVSPICHTPRVPGRLWRGPPRVSSPLQGHSLLHHLLPFVCKPEPTRGPRAHRQGFLHTLLRGRLRSRFCGSGSCHPSGW